MIVSSAGHRTYVRQIHEEIVANVHPSLTPKIVFAIVSYKIEGSYAELSVSGCHPATDSNVCVAHKVCSIWQPAHEGKL